MKNFYFSLVALWCIGLNAQVLTEGFEAETFPPDGWTTYAGENGIGTNQEWALSTTKSNSGDRSAKIRYENVAGGTAEDWMVTPQLSITDSSDAVLKFYASQSFNPDYGSVYYVKVSTGSQDNPSDFVTVAEWTEATLTTGLGFEQKTIDLSDYIGEDIYVAFVMANDNGDDFYVDDVVVGTASCPEPESLSFNENVNLLSWIETGSSLLWDVTVVEQGSALPTDPTYNDLSDASINLDNLSPGVTYEAYVRADCGGDNTDTSVWVSTTFTTECDVYSTPFNQNFENFVPSCWTEATGGSLTTGPDEIENSTWIQGNFANDNNGSSSAKINLSSSETNSWLLSPEISLNDALDYQVQFNLAVQEHNSSSSAGTFGSDDELHLLVTQDGGNTWDVLISYDSSNDFTSGGSLTGALLDDYSGTVQFALYATDGTIDNTEDIDVFVDNFEVIEQVECETPTNVEVVSDINGTTATWDDNDNIAAWDVAVVLSGVDVDASTPYVSMNTNTYSIPNLAVSTDYDLYVRADCYDNGINVSEWVGPVQFTTEDSVVPIGNTCENPLIVGALPYETADDTSNYEDDYDGVQGSNCGSDSQYYLTGDDVVYSYTSDEEVSISISMTPNVAWSGIFVYNSCDDIGTNCAAGVANSDASTREIENFIVGAGETIYIVISTWSTPQNIAYTLNITEDTCTEPTYEITTEGLCETDEFVSTIEFSDLGSGSSYIVSSDLSEETFTVDENNMSVALGPFSTDLSPVITIDAEDDNCDITETLSYTCPPLNDLCTDAESLTIGSTFDSNSVIAHNVGATSSGEIAPGCGSYNGGEVWYTVEVPESGHVIIETRSVEDSYVTDTGILVLSGTCGEFVEIECDDDDSEDGYFSLVELSNRTPGEILYVAVWEYGNNSFDEFQMSAYDDQTCTGPTFTYETNLDCEAGTYTIDFDVTDLGSSPQFDLSEENNSITINSVGLYSFGPYDNNQTVVFTVNTGDENCNSTFSIFEGCAPDNDICVDATDVTVGNNFDSNVVVGSNNNATSSELGLNCGNYNGGEVWYIVEVPESGHIIFETKGVEGSNISDTGMAVFEGTCDALVEIQCNDDNPASGDYFSYIELTDRTPGELLYVAIWEFGNDLFGTFQFSAYDDQTCTPPVYTFDFDPDCEAGTYNIVFDVTELGSNEEFTLSDSEGNTTSITEVGSYTFGPYTDNQLVDFSLDTNDENCDLDFSLIYGCPQTNLSCDEAFEVTVGTVFSTNQVLSSNSGATGTDIATSCNGYNGGEVWFSAVVPPSGSITLEVNGIEGSELTDSVLTAYSGSCDSLVQVGCDDDSSDDGTHALLELDNLTPGEVIYIAVYEYGNNATGQFLFSAYNDNMSVNDLESSSNKFTLYPNPVKGNAYFKGIDAHKATIYNVNGKLIKSFKVINNQIDLNGLATGTYLIEVSNSDGFKQTTKFIKN